MRGRMRERVVAPVSEQAAGGEAGAAGAPSGVRVDVLRRLAEQAMSDADFRAVARDDLPGALARWGYDLNPAELALVTRFRASLADANIDLDLVADFGDERLRRLLNP